MKQVHDLIQGSDEWLQFRAEHFGASECAAMLGLSKTTTRNELLRLKHTGLGKEFSEWVQKNILDYGHHVEAMALPNIEAIFGVDLFPVTCSDGDLSASCDGLSIDNCTAFEHKQWAEELAAKVASGVVPDEHMPQCQQVFMVTGAERLIFAVSDGTPEKLVYVEVLPDQAWFTRILSGWAQFKEDLAAYVPPVSAPVATGVAPETLPALHIELTGMVTASNLERFTAKAIEVFDGINTELVTDDDFANAEKTVKWCSDIEDRLGAAKQHALSQTASIDELFRAIDDIKEQARSKRLTLEKLVKSRKDDIRAGILYEANEALAAHHAKLRDRLGLTKFPAEPAGFAEAMRNKRTIASLRDAVDTALANAKIAANETADRMDVNLKVLRGSEDASLFPDAETLATKEPADVLAIMQGRIAQAKEEAERRVEEARERMRREAQAVAQGGVLAKAVVEHDVQQDLMAPATLVARSEEPPKYNAPDDGARIRLGALNSIIFPLAISADGLASLGFYHVATDKAAKLYRKSDLPRILARMAQHIADAAKAAESAPS